MKLLKNKKKAVKGMTLVEIILALFIFTVCGLMMVEVVNTADKLSKKAIHVNRRVSIEAPYAENRVTSAGSSVIDGGDKKVTINYNSGHAINLKGRMYSTGGAIDPSSASTSGVNANVGYINIDTTLIKNVWSDDDEDEDEEE